MWKAADMLAVGLKLAYKRNHVRLSAHTCFRMIRAQ